MKTVFKGRPVEIEVENLGGDPVDAIVGGGYYLDNMQELTDEELDALGFETDFSEAWMEYQIDRADMYGDD